MTYRRATSSREAADSEEGAKGTRSNEKGADVSFSRGNVPRFILNASTFSTSTAAGNARRRTSEFPGHTERKITNSSRIQPAGNRHRIKTDEENSKRNKKRGGRGKSSRQRWPATRATINNNRRPRKRVVPLGSSRTLFVVRPPRINGETVVVSHGEKSTIREYFR